MCGFAGLYKKLSLTENDKAAVINMSQSIRHRGPDDCKTWFSDNYAFAFRRLSIIDLEAGAQPFTAFDGKYTGIFNGEIYNYLELREELVKKGYTFKTRSEIETILTLYHDEGPEFIKKLRGMFAIVIYNSNDGKLFFGRDPFGIKPFYYRVGSEGISFSSEFKAFLFDPEMSEYSIDEAALQSFFTFQYVTEPDTISPDIKILPAGTYAVIDKSLKVAPKEYYSLKFTPNRLIKFDEKEKRLRDAVIKSVEHHMLSDVPLGSFLSSGIDSAVITAVAAKLCPGIKAFTVAFGVKEYSEIENASGISSHLDIEHIKLVAGLDDFLENYEKVIYHLDSPMADPSTVAIYLICREAARHVKVVLSGEGSDELFGGYKMYKDSVPTSYLCALPDGLKKVVGGIGKMLPEGTFGKNTLMRDITPIEGRFVGNAFVFTEEQKKAFYKKFNPDIHFSDRTKDIYNRVRDVDTLTKMQYCDLNTWLRSDILVKGDRLSMGNSLEVRVPYLDKEVFEAAKDLTSHDKLSHGTTKYILRHAFRDLLNEETVMRPKLGYPVPVRLWLKNELYDWARNIITSPYADEFIEKNAVLKMLEDHRSGAADNYKPLWNILTFITWYKLYVGEREETKRRILAGEL
ncbi:MAG: asparagine synthase (glutamine-hydrolyzing) [Clostridia bacterium]|nr:asparagine synthase (glutamine-hydrolyzing) [Clostridia bacterium]